HSTPDLHLHPTRRSSDLHCVIGFPANINEQSCQQKPVPTALAAWLAANATARDFATCQLAGQPNADIAGGMCQHQRYASFTRGQDRKSTRLNSSHVSISY